MNVPFTSCVLKKVGKIDHTRMYAAMNEKENAQCFGVVRRKPSRGRPAVALWSVF